MYATWTVSQLKAELKSRGASLKGRKADLVIRLNLFDQNFNFGIPQHHETDDTKMDLPSPESYHDINSSTVLPPLSKQHIHLYFNEFDKKPDEGLRLYESRFLVVIRAASLDEHTFIKGLCKASMKRLQYEANLKLHESGQIEETSCECVAGSGITAHCKHVAMVLYAVEHMVREKVMIKHQMPTEKLQKFHVPKKVFASTPIKTSKLSMKRNIDNIIFSPCTMKIDKEEYNKRFRSLVTNYSSSSMPMKQLYEPANPFAVEWDHCYCNVSNETKLLQSFNLMSISPEEATAIELETRGQASNTKWRNHREVRLLPVNSTQYVTSKALAKKNLQAR